jgi:Putative adhesin
MSFLSSRPASGLVVATALSLVSFPALAQVTGHDWQKTYSVSSNPSLTIETGDSSLDIQSCGDCKEIRVQVHSGRDLNNYRLEERQDGDHVSFTLKEKPLIGFHMGWKGEGTKVIVETPAHLELDAKTSDGNFSARELTGNLQVHSGDGSVSLDDVHGALRLTSSDGNVVIRRATGTLEARGSDGHMQVDGQFTGVQMHTSDGNLELTLSPGSQLNAASRIESSDGQVILRVPSTFAADLDVTTSDGRLDCSLPLTMDHYDSNESSGHSMHGRINGGGTPLRVHTSDGNVRITTL